MAVTTTLNAQTLENPYRCYEVVEDAGEMITMADGSYEYRFCSDTGVRRVWEVEWRPLTTTAADTIETAWLAGKTADIVWKPPYTSTTYNVRSVGQFGGDYSVSAGNFYRTVRITLAQADP